ncbi:MAG TPA: hypothetical protein VLZ12_10535 [Verrucomicrobiae bacterium]|nr:hypothetical protein [Verrucomicrobiae bacterium]
MARTVIYECISLETEYSGGIKIKATNYLSQYLEAGWKVLGVSGGGTVQPVLKSEPSQFAIFAIMLEKS